METTIIFDKAALHGCGRGWSVRSRETLKALAVRASGETPESLRLLLEDKADAICEALNKAEGIPVSVTQDNGTPNLLLVGLGRRSIVLWSQTGTAIGGLLKWETDQEDLLADIFG